MSNFGKDFGNAGMVEGNTGLLKGGRLQPLQWILLPVWGVHKGRLIYGQHPSHMPPGGLSSENARPQQATSKPILLDRFIRLAEAKDKEIYDFARRYGPLGLCKRHNLPFWHRGVRGNTNPDEPCGSPNRGPVRFRNHDGELVTALACSEPTAAWRQYASKALAMLKIAAHLHQGMRGSEEDWKILGWPGESDPRMSQRTAVNLERGRLADYLKQEWLRHSGLLLSMKWDAQPRIILGGDWLFGALALRLALAISRASGIASCTECGMPYTPTMRPRADRRHYCEHCGRRAAWRHASQKRAEKKRRGLASHGRPRAE